MTFPGVRESKDRQDVIAYLRAASEGNAPIAERRGRDDDAIEEGQSEKIPARWTGRFCWLLR